MNHCIAKITIDLDQQTPDDRKALGSLTAGIRSRFKISCVGYIDSDGHSATVCTSSFGSHEEDLKLQLDKILEYCEQIGIGRVETVQSMSNSIGEIFEDYEE